MATQKITTGDLNIGASDTGLKITRTISFKNGGTGSFEIKLPLDKTATIDDLHFRSIDTIITLLQEWKEHSKAQMEKASADRHIHGN